MSKKVKLIEKFYVEQNMDILTPQDISKALGWDVKTVERYINHIREKNLPAALISKEGEGALKTENPPQSNVSSIPHEVEVTAPTQSVSSRNLMARHKKRNFVAMTHAASEVGDEIRKSHGNVCVTKAMEEFIYKPFKDED